MFLKIFMEPFKFIGDFNDIMCMRIFSIGIRIAIPYENSWRWPDSGLLEGGGRE